VRRWRVWALLGALATLCLLLLPALAVAQEETEDKFDPSVEFALNKYIPIDLGPIDLSINKAVLYMLISAGICIGFGLYAVRKGLEERPRGVQNVVEMAYEFTETQIARPTLTQSTFPRYFPYIATLFLFIALTRRG